MEWPKVSIVVLGYLEGNRPYLEACLASVENLDYKKELIDIVVVSPWYQGALKTIPTPTPGSFSHSVNAGFQATDPESELILLLSDDTVITRDALKNMVQAATGNRAIVAATSNCDTQWKYVLNLGFEKDGKRYMLTDRFYRIDQLSEYLPEMMNAKSLYPPGNLITDTLCFYAVLIPRAIWNEVGTLDERYKTGFEDSDYCHRAKLLGVKLIVALDAIIWHFGGVTADEIVTAEMREHNQREFDKKWMTNG